MNVGTLLYPSTKLVAIATNCMGVANDNYRAENFRRAISQNAAELKTAFKSFYTYEATLYKPTVIKSSYAKWHYTHM